MSRRHGRTELDHTLSGLVKSNDSRSQRTEICMQRFDRHAVTAGSNLLAYVAAGTPEEATGLTGLALKVPRSDLTVTGLARVIKPGPKSRTKTKVPGIRMTMLADHEPGTPEVTFELFEDGSTNLAALTGLPDQTRAEEHPADATYLSEHYASGAEWRKDYALVNVGRLFGAAMVAHTVAMLCDELGVPMGELPRYNSALVLVREFRGSVHADSTNEALTAVASAFPGFPGVRVFEPVLPSGIA